MELKYKYICKLATKIKKTKNINTNNILEKNEKYSPTDTMYLILSILMNNGLLFEKKFSNYDWYIEKNDFSPYCMWYEENATDFLDYISIPDEEIFDQDNIELIRLLKEEADEAYKRQKESEELDEELYEEVIEEEAIQYMKDMYYEPYQDYTDDLSLQNYPKIWNDNISSNTTIIQNPQLDKVSYQLKDQNGNVSGKKIMWLLRNKCAHNQFELKDNHITLQLNDSRLELIDYDLFVILNAYLEELININTIKYLLEQNQYYSNDEISIDKTYEPKYIDIIKINEIISMFTLLLKEFFHSEQSYTSKNADETLLNFNWHLNNISNFDKTIISTIDNPNYETAEISTLLTMIFVLSNWGAIDIEHLNLNFINIDSNQNKTANLHKVIHQYQQKIEKSQSKDEIEKLKIKITETKISIDYINSNQNTIKHLRNSFAHGYYYFEGETIYIFDYDQKQKQTFSANTKTIDLINFILSNEVLAQIYNIEDIKSKTKH